MSRVPQVPRSVVLLGDSILDNAPYTAPEPDTAAHMRRLLGDSWSVELIAQDGATMKDMPRQLARLPARVGTAVLSIGGNDAAAHVDLLARPVTNAAAVFAELIDIADTFESRYEEVARAVARCAERTVLCTIYEVQLEPSPLARLARVPLGVLNDRIIRTAARLGLEVLEVRDVCAVPSDFVLQIEPSAAGARKIASAIVAVLTGDAGVKTGRIHSAC